MVLHSQRSIYKPVRLWLTPVCSSRGKSPFVVYKSFTFWHGCCWEVKHEASKAAISEDLRETEAEGVRLDLT